MQRLLLYLMAMVVSAFSLGAYAASPGNDPQTSIQFFASAQVAIGGASIPAFDGAARAEGYMNWRMRFVKIA